MGIIFTLHAESRLNKRKISKEEVIEAIRFPQIIRKEGGLYYYQKRFQRGEIEAVVEKTEKSLNVITLYWL